MSMVFPPAFGDNDGHAATTDEVIKETRAFIAEVEPKK